MEIRIENVITHRKRLSDILYTRGWGWSSASREEGFCIREGSASKGKGSASREWEVCLQGRGSAFRRVFIKGGGGLHPSRGICIHGEGFCICRMGSASRMVFIQGGGGSASRSFGLHNYPVLTSSGRNCYGGYVSY